MTQEDQGDAKTGEKSQETKRKLCVATTVTFITPIDDAEGLEANTRVGPMDAVQVDLGEIDAIIMEDNIRRHPQYEWALKWAILSAKSFLGQVPDGQAFLNPIVGITEDEEVKLDV